MNKNKLVIIGLGHVGSYVLADAMKLGLFAEIAVIDRDQDIAYGEALDQEHATSLTYMANTKVRSGDYSECRDADVIIVAAGPNVVKSDDDEMPDRAGLAVTNSEIIREVMSGITAYTKDAIIILITNPLDTVVYIAENEFGYPKGKVFGTGTMLDTARLKKIIANNYDIDPKSVTGFMMGEHGATAFPVLSRLNVAGFGEKELDHLLSGKEPLNREKIKDQVVKAAYDVFNAKGWTNAGIAQAAVTLAKAVLLDERSVYPVSTTLRGQYGYDGDVALSLPCIIGREGVLKQLEVPLDEQEMNWLHQSAQYIQDTMQVAKTGKAFIKM